MCGIAGFSNPKADYIQSPNKWEDILNEMNLVQKHRGPDDEGTFLSSGCGLAHVRLSIIDILTGHQPMIKEEGSRKVAIVFNGEIYNMPALRRELCNDGVKFKTTSDTEVILAGFFKEGIDYIKKLNGIFAIALWDEREKKLFLVRDRLGVKPLFYTTLSDTLIFSSEIKGLFCYPGFSPVLDNDSLCEVFGLGPAKSYGKGVFKGVNEVLPGHVLQWSLDGISSFPYWELESKIHTDSFEETVRKTAYLIKDAITMQMLSDVPICTFLSGGVDSSLVTAICAKELGLKGKKLGTFSFDFAGNDRYFKSNSFQPSQDRPFVDKMVSYCKTDHNYLEASNENLLSTLYDTVDARDLPCMADVESSMLYFCSKVVKKNKVTLTGECADEIFGGYPWFHKESAFKTAAFPWSSDIAPRKLLLKDSVLAELDLEGYAKAAYQKTVDETPKLEGESPTEARRREIAYLNLRWFMATLLDRMDRTSMHVGLEARVPFADHRIVEYVWNVPWEMKNHDGVVKGLLRKAGEEFLPSEILYRKKSPYPKTYNPGYEKALGEALLQVMADSNSPIRSFVDPKKLEDFLSSPSDYGKPWYGQLMAGPQMLAFLLQINYWIKAYHITIA